MVKVLENFGYWVAAPYGDGWTTFERTNENGSKTLWNEVAQSVCPLDENGLMTSSKHPFYARVDATGTVLNCYDDIWKLVPHENTVIAVSEMVATGSRFVDGGILPPAAPAYVPIELPRAELLARLTEDEFAALDVSVEDGETRKVYKTFDATLVYREGTDMWAVLVRHLTEIVTEQRLSELLARPVQAAAMVDGGAEVLA